MNMDSLDAARFNDRLHQHIHEQLTPEHDLRITAAETDDAIILSGTVPSEEARRDAARAAASLAPGKRVQNLLEVERALPHDEALVEAIQRALREDTLTTTLRIEVVVEKGVAHLRGGIPTLEDAENAEAVASRVPGVREVSKELDVAQM